MNGHKIINQNALHFITPTVVSWIDIFTRKQFKDIVIDSLKYCCKNKGLLLYAYVIMSNHLHLIIRADDGFELSNIIRDFKRHTSSTIIKTMESSKFESRRKWLLNQFKYHARFNSNTPTYQLWKRDNYPIELESPSWILTRLNYIHNNPVKAGLVENPEDYIYCSARNYLDYEDVKIEVLKIDLYNMEGYVSI